MRKKLHCNETGFNLLCALYFTFVLNGLFIHRAIAAISLHQWTNALFAASVPLVLFCAFTLIFSLFVWPWIRKPLLVILLLTGAAANYFVYSFGIVINSNMMQNVFETNPSEIGALISGRYVLWLALMAGVPAVLNCLTTIKSPRSWWQGLGLRALCAGLSLLGILLAAALFYKDYASLIRNNSTLIKMVTPVNVISGSIHYASNRWLQRNQTLVRLGEDAHKGPLLAAEHKKTLVVLVLGETARAANFSLGGYPRETNPKLKQQDVIYYQHASSCGTETAVSVPCMFSAMSAKNYKPQLARYQEGLLDVMAHAGINILWRENDGGCKGVCNRVPHTDMTQWQLSDCHAGVCTDNVLLHRLSNYIDGLKGDGLVVLHQMGSHGPTYYQRYPASMRKFTPTCDSKQIQDCDRQALINTYDNTILYTDSMLSDTIDLLKSRSNKFNVALVYLSDHGESLGEYGLYLHGTPIMFAPVQQTHIPFLLWLSPDYARTFAVNTSCLRQHARDDTISQDNLFHTLLGMLNIQTQVRQPQLDLLQKCQFVR